MKGFIYNPFGVSIINTLMWKHAKKDKLTADKSMCDIVLMMLAISLAAVMHRILLSALTDAGSLFDSALKMAAWCRQMVEVWMLMFVKMTLALFSPAGSLR